MNADERGYSSKPAKSEYWSELGKAERILQALPLTIGVHLRLSAVKKHPYP
jgi:hypothetical protein